jgi:hypothetical protein
MEPELNGNHCECVDCRVLRYDMALDAVVEAKVKLADAFIEADELLDMFLTGDGLEMAVDALAFYTAAIQKRNALVKEVARLQVEANRRLDLLIARKRELDGDKHG